MARKLAASGNAAGNDRLKIFISYSRQDATAADTIVAALTARGFDVTIDTRDLPFGEKWQAELAEFIRLSDTVIWLVSEASIKSHWVNWELDEVARRNKRLVPLMVGLVNPAELPRQLGEIHILPPNRVFNLGRDLDTLVQVLETDHAWLKQASRLQDRAHEWLTKSRASALLLSRGALADAERWKDRRPTKAPAPAQEVMDLLLASRQAATRRQRWWVGGSLAGLSMLTQIGLLSLFFRNDALLNEARYSLQNGKVELSQRQLTHLLDNPINRVLPASASAHALATQFLDTALVEGRHVLPTVGRKRDNGAFGELLPAGEQLYGVLSTPTRSLIFRCDAQGRACETAPLGDDWNRVELVRDGADVFVVSHEEDSRENFKIARVPASGALTLASQPLEQAKLSQVRKLEDGFVWRGKDYTRILASRDDLFQEAPALTTNPKYAAVAGYVKLRLKPDKNQKSEPTDDDDDGHVRLTAPAACSQSRVICITARTDLEADARGTITQFDLWRVALAARGASTSPEPAKAKAQPEAKTPAAAAAKAKPAKKPLPTPVAEYDMIVEELFEPLPSQNMMAVSPDGSTIVISENKRVHIWLTARVTERDRRQFKTFELAEEPLAILFESNGTDLVVLTPTALMRVKLSPRAVVATSGNDSGVRRATNEDDDYPKGLNKISRLHNGMDILRTESGAILASRGRGLREVMLHQPPPRSTLDVETWDGDGLVSVYYRNGDTTVLIEPEASASRASPLAGRLAGKLIQIGLNGRLAITLRPNCVLRLHSSATAFAEISPLGTRAKCELDKDQLKFLAPEKADGESVLIITVPSPTTSEDGSPFKAFVVDFKGGKPAARPLLDGSRQQSSAAHWTADIGVFPDPDGSLVLVETDGGVKTTKLPIADTVVRDLARKSLAAGKLDIRMLSRDDHMVFLDATECAPPTGKDGREIAGSFALLSRRGESLVPQFLLTCVPRFPDQAHGHNADTSHIEIAGRHLIGAYPFPALLEWKPREAALRMLLLPEPDGDAPGRIEVANLPFSTDTNTSLKNADLRNLKYLAFWAGATAIDASEDASRVLIFREAHGSAGHSKAAGVIDLSRMTYRYTPNDTADFFDNISRAVLSPNGELILTHKAGSNRFELFRFHDLQKIPLPDGIETADFDGNDALTLKMGSGAQVRWLAPESQGKQIDLIRSIMTVPR
jgi:hypothetical protein